jgi:trimeric autotransporter adhesin
MALVALTLLASAGVVLVSLLFGQGAPSSRAQVGHGQARHGLDAMPLAARGAVARALGADDRRWFAHPVAGGFVLGTRGTGAQASFSRRDVIVRSGALSWSLGLRGYGYGNRLAPVRPVSPAAHANRVIYRRGGVAEWYAGGPLGLEQGFTLTQRPRGKRAGPLTLSIGHLPQGVTARVDGDRRGLVLAAAGRHLLRYGSLFASDSRGRSLPARMELSGGRLRLLVDDRGAAYPLRVDPLVQVAKLTASGAAAGDLLGYSVAMSSDGSTVAAGAPQRAGNQGVVYVFTQHAGGWANATQTAELVALAGASGDKLGSSVAISGDGATVVAGAPGRSSGVGAAYVFVRPGGGWSNQNEAAELTASDAAANDAFGSSIAVSGDGSMVAAGAPLAAIAANSGQGAAYVFLKPAMGWGSDTQPQHQAAKLTASDGAADDGLGGDNGGSALAVSSDGSTVAAGAATATASGCPANCTFGPGAVYVFVRPNSGWTTATQTAKLTASDGQGNDRFGDAVALSSDGSTLVAGAFLAVVSTDSKRGAAYVFAKPQGGWTGTSQHETAKLTAQDGHGQDQLGRAVAISSDGSTIAAGAYLATVGPNAAQGKVYVFDRPGTAWTTGTAQAELTAADGGPGDELGFSVATSGDGSIIVGGAKFASPSDEGAAYVFAPFVSNPLPPPAHGFGSSSSAPTSGGAPGGYGGGTAPAVGGAGVSPSTFPAAPSGSSAQAARVRRYGTRVTFTLRNQAAGVRFTVQQSQPGRKVKHGKRTTCGRPTRKNAKRKRCTRIVTLKGSFTVAGVVGTNTFRFTGRLNGKSLAPGKYTLVATPTANGKTGRAAKASFKIVR